MSSTVFGEFLINYLSCKEKIN